MNLAGRAMLGEILSIQVSHAHAAQSPALFLAGVRQ